MRISRTGADLLVQTPAKLNLSLKVLGKRENGFHDLETLMVSIRLHDTLQFSPIDSKALELTASNAQIPTDEQNLVIKAARLLREVTGAESGAKIHLTKRIPSEAGLGGGSSDAAATLVCLNQFWNLNLSNNRLHELAAQLGSDVNFFLDSNIAATCTGRGEQITPVVISRPLNLVVIKPKSGLSTGKVFEQLKMDHPETALSSESLPDALGSGNLRCISHGVFNSLEQSAKVLSPEVEATLKMIKKQSVIVAGMSGSGTACFGLCRSWRHAQRVASSLRVETQLQTWAIRTGM